MNMPTCGDYRHFWDPWGLLSPCCERLDAGRPSGDWSFPEQIAPDWVVEFTAQPTLQKWAIYAHDLWAIGRSPLIFGGDRPSWTTSQTNLKSRDAKSEPQSTNNRQVSRDKKLIVWAADVPNSKDNTLLFSCTKQGDNLISTTLITQVLSSQAR